MNTLGIDIGTTSLSFVIANQETKKIVKSYTVANESFIATGNNWERCQDPQIIWKKVAETIKKIDVKKEQIAHIGLTGQMHGILYVDIDGNAVSLLYTWQDGSGDKDYKNHQSYAQYLTKITGYSMASGFGGTTYYVHQVEGIVPEKASCFCTIMDYIGMKLTSRKVPLIDATNAASIGLFDRKEKTFDQEAIQQANLSVRMFPTVVKEATRLGYTVEGIPVAVAIGDNQASFLGAIREEDREHSILVNVGTGSQVSFLVPEYCSIKGMETRPFIGEHYLLVSSSLCGGRAYAMLKEFYEKVIVGFAEIAGENFKPSQEDLYKWMNLMVENALKNPDTLGQLSITPTFCGTRQEPEKRGAITGLSPLNFSPEALTYAMLEGIAEELYQVMEGCNEGIRAPMKKLVGSGNGIRKNEHLQKIFTKKFNLPLELSNYSEEAAYGAAMHGKNIKSGDIDC